MRWFGRLKRLKADVDSLREELREERYARWRLMDHLGLYEERRAADVVIAESKRRHDA